MSSQITQQFSQSLFRFQDRTRSWRHCGGSRPRRLIKTLQPSSQCPTGANRSHRDPDVVPTSDWCLCTRDARQGPDRVCFSSLSVSNPRSMSYDRCRRSENRSGVSHWGLSKSVQVRGWRRFWSRHACHMTDTMCEKPPSHDRSYHITGVWNCSWKPGTSPNKTRTEGLEIG